MKVALVHDYLREYGGAERVVEALHEIFPKAPLFVASYYKKGLGEHAQRFTDWDIRSSWFDKLHLPNKLISPFRVFASRMFESFDLSEFDVVISSSAIYFAKAVKVKPKALHLAYIHTPPRFLYGYTTSYNYKKHWWTRIGGEVANHFLRILDFNISQRPHLLIANSQNIQKRIAKFYRRDSLIIHPPVDIENLKGTKKTSGDYYLSLGRLVRGKGVDVIVKACTELNFPLKVAGTGPLMEELKKKAGKSIEFLGHVTDQERIALYASAKAFIVASEDEDFGITQIEAMAAGTPVIAINAGGYKETIIPGKTGEFFESFRNTNYQKAYDVRTIESLKEVLKKFNPTNYKEEDCRRQADKFSFNRFKKDILRIINHNI
jgi:glycosyltransferase involved in cell wall biosynthesis